jgi:hypothetical protein
LPVDTDASPHHRRTKAGDTVRPPRRPHKPGAPASHPFNSQEFWQLRFIVADMSFVVNYTKTKASPARAVEYEKSFLTMGAALNFCVQLIDLGGDVLYIVQFIYGTEDAVLEGTSLVEAIDRQRARIASA